MTFSRANSRAGFTVGELIIGTALSAIILAAVISSYLFLGRQFTRLMNQQTLEMQARRTLLYLAQDARLSTAIASPTNTSVILTQTTNSGTRNITYTYSGTTLTRADSSSGTTITLHSNLLTCYFRYYDDSGNPYDNGASPYTTVTTYASGMSQISLLFTAQTGVARNGTLTAVYQGVSARLIIRNKSLLY